MEDGIGKISSALWFICLVLSLMGMTLSVKLGTIECHLKRIAGPPKPIVKLRRYDKNGKALYEVDANIEIVSSDAKNFVQNDDDGRFVCDGVSVVYTEQGKRRCLE